MDKMIGEFDKELFEHIHMMLFVIVLFYITITCCLIGYSIWSANQYKKIEEDVRRNEERYANIRNEYHAQLKHAEHANSFILCLKSTFSYRYNDVLFRYQFSEIRRLFFEQHAKKYKEIEGKQFEFYIYLRKCMRAATINIAMIHWQVWLTILILILLNTFRILVASTSEVSSFIVMDALVLWGVTMWVFYLRYRLMWLLRTLSGPATYVKHCKNREGSF